MLDTARQAPGGVNINVDTKMNGNVGWRSAMTPPITLNSDLLVEFKKCVFMVIFNC